MSVQLAALIANVGLALLKFTVGALAQSRALIADAFNSAGDIVATFVAWIAFRYGSRPPDEDHPYGHQNAEALAGLLIGAMLSATGAFIFIDGLFGIFAGHRHEPPGALAIWAAVLTAVAKETLYRVSMRVGARTNSPTLLASARDHRADVVSACVALVGIVIARLGWPEFDSIAGALIGVYIFRLGIGPVRSNMAILMHEAPPRLAIAATEAASSVPGVLRIALVRVQPIGGQWRMDLTLHVDGDLSVTRAHEIAHAVERSILASVANVVEVHVHVEPA
jgi:cation diffusion facilitator family transporter